MNTACSLALMPIGNFTIDSPGSVYAPEIDTGKRAQRCVCVP